MRIMFKAAWIRREIDAKVIKKSICKNSLTNNKKLDK
jgi:hypothetical protein